MDRHIFRPRPTIPIINVIADTPSVLSVQDVNMCFQRNGYDHQTSRYELMKRKVEPHLVARRGQPFTLRLSFNRPYNPETDVISFMVVVKGDERPNYGRGTFATIPLETEESDNLSWSAVLSSNIGQTVTVNITSPASCIVGIWGLEVDTELKSSGEVSCFTSKSDIYILFNAWCEQDQVFMEEERRRQEYVVVDAGLVWKTGGPQRWDYRQYEKDILFISIQLMTKTGRVPLINCNNPVKVIRALSAAVNSVDDDGVIEGEWNDYSDGIDPSYWRNSEEILRRYCNSDFETPVKYGQCWVFAGVLTTVCRALGIPCRPVTTFGSGHDTKGSLTIDTVYDDKLNKMDHLSDDSAWNYHVWNEVWMRRPDLEPGDYDGWNAVDATPQEESDGVFRCGPASVKAIRRGEVLKPYDTEFFFGETNAEEFCWRYTGPMSPLKLLVTYKNRIGYCIMTKEIGSWEGEDITFTYKYQGEKKIPYFPGTVPIFKRKSEFTDEHKQVKVDIEPSEDICIGNPFSVVAVVTNSSKDKDFTVNLTLRAAATTYTGKLRELVKIDQQEFLINKESEAKVTMNVSFQEYYDKLVDQNDLNLMCLARVEKTGFECFTQSNLHIRMPPIRIQVGEHRVVGKLMPITARFINPLAVPLTNGSFTFEGVGLDKAMKIELSTDVAPHAEARASVSMMPQRPGSSMVLVNFQSSELKNIHDSCRVTVQENPFSN